MYQTKVANFFSIPVFAIVLRIKTRYSVILRYNPYSGPIYKLITTELGGERRFAASVARRLQSLGALTKGDRRAATGADLSMFNYDTIYGRTALKFMYQHICKV